jgi:hypothetical protein
VSRYIALQTARLLPRRARNDVSQLSGEGVQGQASPVLLSTWATGGPGGVAVGGDFTARPAAGRLRSLSWASALRTQAEGKRDGLSDGPDPVRAAGRETKG